MAEVRLENVYKQFEKSSEPAVKDVSIHIADGEFAVLVGPSGCGKSTTLRMIAGLETQSGGDIYIGDRRVNDDSPRDRNIAMVFQDYALYPHMTVRQNLAFGLKLRKTPEKEIEERVIRAADILGIQQLLDRRPRALSGGQRQRVAVGRAIVRKPDVFLFDEPLSNLDAKLRVQMRTEINRLHHSLDATMIYVTHDQVEAMTMGDRIIVMNQGAIQQIATPMTLYNKPTNLFTAGFIGSPAMNFISGTWNRGGFQHQDLEIALPHIRIDGEQKVVLGVRPEHFRLAENETPHITVTVSVIEQMGNETLVYFPLGENIWVARLAPESGIKPEDRIPLLLDAESVHIFDNTGPEQRNLAL